MKRTRRRVAAGNYSEKITTEDEQTNLSVKQSHEEFEKEMDAILGDISYMRRQRFRPPSMEEDFECEDDWSLEEYARRGIAVCPECFKGNFCEVTPSPERVEEGAGQAIAVEDSEKITMSDEVFNLLMEARENMDEKDFYEYWDGLYEKQPPPSVEECDDNACSSDELIRRGGKTVGMAINSSSSRRKIKRAKSRKKETPSLWTFKLFKRMTK